MRTDKRLSISRNELIAFLDTIYGVTDRLKRHSDCFTYEGSTNEVEALADAMMKWTKMTGYYADTKHLPKE